MCAYSTPNRDITIPEYVYLHDVWNIKTLCFHTIYPYHRRVRAWTLVNTIYPYPRRVRAWTLVNTIYPYHRRVRAWTLVNTTYPYHRRVRAWTLVNTILLYTAGCGWFVLISSTQTPCTAVVTVLLLRCQTMNYVHKYYEKQYPNKAILFNSAPFLIIFFLTKVGTHNCLR